MDYRKTAQEILGYVGGSKNIVSAGKISSTLSTVRRDCVWSSETMTSAARKQSKQSTV